ncbi:hypothetical protein VNI00_018167 [Paramarasmius palmivorus]|uniref:Uncharacterized protein n=1 Tax=Paramarasmius palmivorus TaxID=297713 RepID=A0AAW0B0K4_9AGAR
MPNSLRHLYLIFPLSLLTYCRTSHAFDIQVQSHSDVNEIDNISFNWTWYPEDPLDITISLFTNRPPTCAPFGEVPIGSEGIIYRINSTTADLDGQKHGLLSFTMNKTGDYVLCAFQVLERTGDYAKDPVRLITNSTVISVTTHPKPTAIHGGIIAGSVLGGLVLLFIVTILFRLYRKRNKSIQPTIEAHISPYPNVWIASGSPRKLGEDIGYTATDHELRALSDRPHNTIATTSTSRGEDFDSRVLYHEDSGWRPSPHEGRVREVPPGYDSAL